MNFDFSSATFLTFSVNIYIKFDFQFCLYLMSNISDEKNFTQEIHI